MRLLHTWNKRTLDIEADMGGGEYRVLSNHKYYWWLNAWRMGNTMKWIIERKIKAHLGSYN